jgi:type IV pilus assembly protein PilA
MTPKTIKDRVRGKDGGFTLVELMVVVMIIAILMAIAIPTFLNSRKRAQDSSAKSNVRTALSAAQAVYSEDQSYVDTTTDPFVAALTAEEPSLDFVAGSAESTAPKIISVTVATGGETIYLTSESTSGRCFALRHSVASGDTGGSAQAELAKDADCTAAGASATTVVYEPI